MKHWKTVLLFDSILILNAPFILRGGGSLILAAVVAGGEGVLSLLIRPARYK